jgi:DNA mismatch endonuclease (patch repair protein)
MSHTSKKLRSSRGPIAATPERSPTSARSRLMGRVRQAGTGPELAVRQILRRQGHRFKTNGRMLPGSPDIYDSVTKRAVFVHGCYWHRHPRCRGATTPGSNRAFWQYKFANNIARDRRNVRALRARHYSVMIVWECQTKSPAKRARLKVRLERFFRRDACLVR